MGYCRSHAIPKIASVNLHYGEEPPISGERGSGTIFFSGCNLSCIFCQNYPISQLGNGKETNLDSLVDAMLRLQKRGAHNINFVTPSHATVTLEVAIPEARKLGLEIPIVYNTSGYDSLQQLRRLDGLIDIYLSDIRYADHEVAEELSNARDYPEVNRVALIEMQQQVGNLDLDKHGIARRGLVIRHLVFPCGLANTSSALDFIANEISPEAHVALMSQYFPAYKAVDSPSLNRKINKEEWVEAVRLFRSSGLNGWVQKKE
ncbi:radical SAM protein [bacterium]|nr:radical SAM protein [bacterium]